MRLVFECLDCTMHYLPPEDLRYTDGAAASPVHCSRCQTRLAAQGVVASPAAVAVALMLARRAAPAPSVDTPPRPDARPTRPARSRRAGRAPGGARSKLH